MFDFYPLVYFDDYFVQMGWFNHQLRKNDKKITHHLSILMDSMFVQAKKILMDNIFFKRIIFSKAGYSFFVGLSQGSIGKKNGLRSQKKEIP